MWVTSPYHPDWATHVAKAIRKFMHDESWSTIHFQGFEGHQHLMEKITNVHPAWYNFLQPPVFQVQGMTK